MRKLLTVLFLSSLAALPVSADVPVKPAPVILRTPAAPIIPDSDRLAELARRRAEVGKMMLDKSIMVLMSTEPKLYAYDVDYVYRQENNLYYLTALKQADATLVLVKDGGTLREYLFLPKREPRKEAWEGKMYSGDQASKLSGLNTLIDSAELNDFIKGLKEKGSFTSKDGTSINASFDNVYLLAPENPNDKREYRAEMELAAELKTGGRKTHDASEIFAALRHIKSPYELKLLQHAIDISTEAHMRSMAMVGRAKWEYEVQAEVEYTFRRRNADFWGYPSIVGCGPNATTLHYVESQSPVKQGDLLLMDVGAEYDHYTADVTRTFPVNGKFTKEQAEIYRIVYDAQEAVARATKPGASMRDIEVASERTIAAGLAKLGLTTGVDATFDMKLPDGRMIKMPQSKLWFIHGNSHWLGMNVHDVGDYGAKLKAGMVFTNEPGIYLREDSLDYLADTPENKAMIEKIRPVYERYKNIGVRIEDDMLVTATGVEWMTKKLPRKLEEVEAFMAAASKEMPYEALNLNGAPTLKTLGIEAFASFDAFQAMRPSGQTARRGYAFGGGQSAGGHSH